MYARVGLIYASVYGSLLEDTLIELGYRTQWVKADPQVEQSWMPSTFPSLYLNNEHILWIDHVLCKGHIHGS